MQNVLDIRDLSVDFETSRGTIHALRQVSLKVPRNKTVGIVGESGCGKSTLISTVLRLLANNAEIVSGQVLFNGVNTLDLSVDALRQLRGNKIAMVFQDPMTAQNPVISIARQMSDIQYRDSAASVQQRRMRAIDMLRRVGIPDPESRILGYPHEFSGGMRQRIAIAMALLMRPDLLIADEPTTALDVNMEAQIIFLLRQLQRQFGTSVLFVSHNLGLIAELCDEVIVMYAGEVVEKGKVQDLFHNPQHPYTQKLLECDPARLMTRTSQLPTIPGRVPDLRNLAQGCIFAPRCHKAFGPCTIQTPIDYAIALRHTARCHLLGPQAPSPLRAAPRERTRPHGANKKIGKEVLEVANLRVRFRTDGLVKAFFKRNRNPYVDAVMNVSLQVRRGETFGLVGESGSGKTTLGCAVMGLIAPFAGSIRFGDVDLTAASTADYNRQRRKMAMMFQDPVGSLSPRRTARALVMEPFEIHGIPLENAGAEAERLFAMVGLSPQFFNRYPHELSGGQARRVGVARALALAPELIIADEPTAGLDTSVQGEILNLMTALQQRDDLSYLIISHNLPAIRHVSDRIGVMYLGRLVEQGPASKVFEQPAHPYTRALIDGVPRPDPDLRRELLSIEGEVPSLTERPSGCEFHPRCPFATERCRSEAPLPRPLGEQRIVSCHFPLTGSATSV